MDNHKSIAKIDIVAIFIFSVVGAALLAIGSNSNTHDADSLLPAFMSTQKLTWYYWDQNRFANLLPLIAAPIQDISANFYFQVFLRNLGAFWSIAFGLLLLSDQKYFLERFLLGVIVFIVGAPNFSIFGVAVPHPVSCGLFAAGLLLIGSRSTKPATAIAALLLFWAAFLVNISLLVIVLPISFGCFLISIYGKPTQIGRPISLGLIAASAVAAYVHSSFFEPKTPSTLRYAPNGFSKATTAILDLVNLELICGLLLASLGACALRLFIQRRPADAIIPAPDLLAICTAVGTVWLLVNLSWVQANGFSARYFNVNLTIMLAIAAGWSTTMLDRAGLMRIRPVSVSLLMAAAAFFVWRTAGPPTLKIEHVTGVAGAEHAFNGEKETLLSAIPSDRPAIFVGNYWYVTPLAFEWNSVHKRLDGYPLADDFSHARAIFPLLRQLLQNGAATIVCIGIPEERCKQVIHNASDKNIQIQAQITAGDVSAGEYRIFMSDRAP